jgi:hypothetical protein
MRGFNAPPTPKQDKIQRLSETLLSVNKNLGYGKSSRYENLERKCQALEDSLWEFTEQHNRKLNTCKTHVARLGGLIDEERKATELFVQESGRELNSLKEQLQLIVYKIEEGRRDYETKVLKLVEKVTDEIRQDMKAESKHRFQAFEEMQGKISKDLPDIEEMISSEAQYRDSIEIRLKEVLSEEIFKLQKELDHEKRLRDEREESLLQEMRHMLGTVKTALDKEKTDRETTEETLLSLLEETCHKINELSEGPE